MPVICGMSKGAREEAHKIRDKREEQSRRASEEGKKKLGNGKYLERARARLNARRNYAAKGKNTHAEKTPGSMNPRS